MLTVVPSIYLAYRIVQKAIFEKNARSFVQREFKFNNTQVVHQSFKFDTRHPSIELLVIGEELNKHTVDSLDSNWLTIHQGLDAKKEIDLAQIRIRLPCLPELLPDILQRPKKQNLLAG